MPFQTPYQGIAGYQTGISQGPLFNPQQTADMTQGIRAFTPAAGNAFGGNTGLQDQYNALHGARRNEAATGFGRALGAANTQMDFARQQADSGAGRSMQGWLGNQYNQQAQYQANPIVAMLQSLLMS